MSNKEADGEPENALSIHSGGKDQVMDDMPSVDVIKDLQNEAKEHVILFIERYMPAEGGGGVALGWGQLEDRP